MAQPTPSSPTYSTLFAIVLDGLVHEMYYNQSTFYSCSFISFSILCIHCRFTDLWKFPHCLREVDGKHVRRQCPRNASSEYLNNKIFHAINFMAICDANLLFKQVVIGQSGRWSDSGVFEMCSFGTALMKVVLSHIKPILWTCNSAKFDKYL